MNQVSHPYVTSVTTHQQLTRDRLSWEGRADKPRQPHRERAAADTGGGAARQQAPAVFCQVSGPAAGASGVCQVKALVMTRQSCPPPLDAVLTRMPALAPIGAGIPDFPRKALLGWQVPLPGLSTVTRIGWRHCPGVSGG